MGVPSGLVEPIRGACDIQAYSKRYWGQPYPFGWGLEHSFPALADRTPTGDPDEARQAWLGSWTHTGTEIIPELRALALAPYPQWIDSWPVGCANEAALSSAFSLTGRTDVLYWTQTAGTWMPTAPTGYTTSTYEQIWMTCTDLASNVATATSVGSLPANAYLTLSFYRWSPTTPFATQRPYVEFTVGASATLGGGLKIRLPLSGPSTDAAQRVPTIRNAETSELLAELDQMGIGAGSSSMFDKLDILNIRPVEPGLFVVSVPGSDTAALIHSSGAAMNAAPIVVTCAGAYIAFGVTVNRYILPGGEDRTGYATKAYTTEWPEYINGYSATVTHDSDPRGYTPGTTTITCDNQATNVPSVTTQPKVTLHVEDSADTYVTPVCYLLHEVHPPLWFGREATKIGDLSDFCDAVDVYETADMRMARADLALRKLNDTTLTETSTLMDSITGNEWVHVGPVYHQWPDYTLAQDQASGVEDLLAGWLSLGQYVREGGIDEGDPNWTATVLAWPYRFVDGQKTMLPHADMSWAGWNFKEAVERILPAHGVPTAALSWAWMDTYYPGVLDTLEVPCERKWERRYAYTAEDPVLDALDELSVACGLRWRITRAGLWEWFVPQAWDGVTYEHTLDGDQTSTFVDVIERIAHGADDRELRNLIYHEGADAYGQVVPGLVQDYVSLFDTASPRFTGDMRWSVRTNAGNVTPELTAYLEYQRRLRESNRVSWTWAGHPDWKPGDRVRIDVDGIGLTAGTTVEIVEKTSRIRAQETRYTETVEAAVVGWA